MQRAVVGCGCDAPELAPSALSCIRLVASPLSVQPDLLFQLLSMLSPRVLVQHGVPVYSATQVRANLGWAIYEGCCIKHKVRHGVPVCFATQAGLLTSCSALGVEGRTSPSPLDAPRLLCALPRMPGVAPAESLRWPLSSQCTGLSRPNAGGGRVCDHLPQLLPRRLLVSCRLRMKPAVPLHLAAPPCHSSGCLLSSPHMACLCPLNLPAAVPSAAAWA